MSFFISDAIAQAAPATQSDPLMSFLPLVILFVVFYFLLIRPQQKKAKEHKTMVQNLSKGDEIVTQGGILGKVTDVSENILTCKIADNVEVKVQSHAVATVLPKGTIKNL
ncbi:MAG: preprotein translocase subunit YajC [Gammaproteobacteria bacterium]|nr:preprotein translocase subunit YajC [Gammaproteobacteria bacterium]MBL7000750.1 preprotein translocase subunit YajC [Gammaproteobacteria bacterium]